MEVGAGSLEKCDIAIEGDATIIAPESLFYQVMLNLIHNAHKSKDGGAKVRVSVDENEKHWVMQVSDNGRGIPAEYIERVFQAFFKIEEGGSGIGLAVCRRAVEKMGGEIGVQSIEGEGTTFTITLPKEL